MGFLSDVMTDPRPASDDNETQARQRARRRLIGAGVLLAIGVIGFPLLFETKPRPVTADVPAVQSSRERPVVAASTPKVVERAAVPVAGAASAAATAASAPSVVAERASEVRREIAIPPAATTDATKVAQEKEKAERERAEKARADKERLEKERIDKAKAERTARDQAKADEARRAAKADEERRARVAREGRASAKTTAPTAPTAPEPARFAVQVGAFASESSVRDVRNRLERVGLKSYTQVVRSTGSSAATTRVRTGPYASRQEADRAAEKARSIGLSPSVVPIASAAR